MPGAEFEVSPGQTVTLSTVEPICPEWQAEMTNEQLANSLEICRTGESRAVYRNGIWERWAEAEAEDHNQLRKGALHGGLEN